MDRLPELSFSDLLNMAMLNDISFATSGGMSKIELAKRAGLRLSHVSMLCAGKREPGFKTIRKIKKAFSFSGEYWLA